MVTENRQSRQKGLPGRFAGAAGNRDAALATKPEKWC